MEDPKLAKLEALLKLVDESISKKDFEESFKVVVDLVEKLKTSNLEEFKLIRETVNNLSDKLRGDSSTTLEELKEQAEVILNSFKEEMREKMLSLKDGKNGYTPIKGVDYFDGETIVGPKGDNGSPDTGDEIIEKINTADSLIHKEAIQGFAELEKKVEEKTGTTTRIGWGSHPLTVQGLGVTIDKNTRVINFKGSGLSSVARLPNRVVEVTLSAGAGSDVYEETPSGDINGVNTTYTVLHTIATVYNIAINGQFLHPTVDYTKSGDTITMVSPLDASLSGKPFTITYS